MPHVEVIDVRGSTNYRRGVILKMKVMRLANDVAFFSFNAFCNFSPSSSLICVLRIFFCSIRPLFGVQPWTIGGGFRNSDTFRRISCILFSFSFQFLKCYSTG